MLSADDTARLRDALLDARFTVGTVGALLGDGAHRALLRNETTPARRATSDGSAASTLTRLFSLQLPVPDGAAGGALPGLVEPMCAAGMLARSGGEVRALLDVRPYGDTTASTEHDWWVVCDLTPGLDTAPVAVRPDHVLGISEASSSLAQLTVRDPVGSAMDLGTGCGVQALHLSSHVDRVVATDVNPRALAMARLTAALAGVQVDLRDGSLFEPVAAESFDLVVTNPPFVVSPATDERLVYRDSGLPGDEVVRRIVTEGAHHLNPGGWCQVLANWVHREDEPWAERLTRWIEPTGCDAWVLQREVADLPTYVEMWLADAGLRGAPDYVRRYDRWLAWFDEQGIEAVGFGWLCLRNAGRECPVVRVEHWPYEVEQPLGPHVAAWGARTDRFAASSDDELLGTRLRQVDGLRQETSGPAGAADPETILVRLQRGVRRARSVDTAEAAVIGACDGELALGQILDAVASLLGRDAADVRTTSLRAVRALVAEGYLH